MTTFLAGVITGVVLRQYQSELTNFFHGLYISWRENKK